MIDRNLRLLRLRAIALAGLGCCMPLPQLLSQEPPPVMPAQFDPSDVYFQGFLATRAAEALEANGDFAGAWEKLEQARKLFESVRTFYPDWKPDMVGGRHEKTVETLTALRPKAQAQRFEERNVVAELEGGVNASGRTIDPSGDVMPLTPGILEIEPLAARRLSDAEAEVERLRGLLEDSATPPSDASRTASRLRDVARQRDDLQRRLQAAETNVQSLRSRLAASPVETELKSLNQRIEDLEKEREAMAGALTKSRGAHIESMSRIKVLEADLAIMRQKQADLDRDLQAERQIANEVVAGQRRQLQELESQLKQKSAELTAANERIAELSLQLEESRGAFAQLRDEHHELLRERDQMAALLKLNESSRIQDLIEQNMGLSKDLREANERVERLNLDSNATKDELTNAKNDLTIAKTRINNLLQERRAQDQRLADLETRLKNEEGALSRGEASADPAEVEVLREIIRRQLRVQERRRQARDLLVAAAKDLGAQDEKLAQAIELFDGQEISLTPEEQKLLADKQVDGEFISPFARDRATVGLATEELHREIAVFERTAEKAFIAGRFLPTRELFQMIVEQHPGHTPALCKLGVVHLKLDEPAAAAEAFRRAVELDETNPYAHRMLAFSLLSLGDLPAAENHASRSVDLAPDDANSRTLYGNVLYSLGRPGDAEAEFKAAISADPLPSEPYFNLALHCARTDRLEEAKEYYSQALERGAVPDPSLEQRLFMP
jgi:tetratricopeptide (TPR) repeat protein